MRETFHFVSHPDAGMGRVLSLRVTTLREEDQLTTTLVQARGGNDLNLGSGSRAGQKNVAKVCLRVVSNLQLLRYEI